MESSNANIRQRLITVYIIIAVFLLLLSWLSLHDRHELWLLIGFLGAISGLMLIINIYNNRIARPIEDLRSALGRMAEGKPSHVPVKDIDEIGRLIMQYNLTTTSIEDKIDQIEKTLDDNRRLVRQLAVLNDITSLISSELEIGPILSIIANRAKDIVKAEHAAVILFDKHKMIIKHIVTSDKGALTDFEPRPVGIIHNILEGKMPLLTSYTEPVASIEGIPYAHPPVRNTIAVPMLLGTKIIGELILFNRIGEDGFTHSDEDILLTLCFQGAMVIEKSILHQEILVLSKTDGLTSLNNHRAFQEKMEEEIERAKRYKRNLALLMMDIDFFKKFNDTYGHLTGDDALKKISCIMLENLRNIDFAARYGGEEFAIILVESTYEGAIITAERIRSEISTANFSTPQGKRHLTVSVGLSYFPEDGNDRIAIIGAADKALYLAKRSGRNMVKTFKELGSKLPAM